VDRKKTSSSVLPSRIGKFALFCRATTARFLPLRPICFFVSLRNERQTIISLLHPCRIDPPIKHCQTPSAPAPRLSLTLPHLIRTPEIFLFHPRLFFDIDLEVRGMPIRKMHFESSSMYPVGSIVIRPYSLIACRVLRGSAHTFEDFMSSFAYQANGLSLSRSRIIMCHRER
jgi:hypothetical protein